MESADKKARVDEHTTETEEEHIALLLQKSVGNALSQSTFLNLAVVEKQGLPTDPFGDSDPGSWSSDSKPAAASGTCCIDPLLLLGGSASQKNFAGQLLILLRGTNGTSTDALNEKDTEFSGCSKCGITGDGCSCLISQTFWGGLLHIAMVPDFFQFCLHCKMISLL